MINKIIIVAGDPNSINLEIISKTWRKLDKITKKKIAKKKKKAKNKRKRKK